jgi:hypothetical protein
VNQFDQLLGSVDPIEGIYLSTDDGVTWTYAGPFSIKVNSLLTNGGYLFAGTDGHGVLLSSNSGASWETMNTGLADSSISSIVVHGTSLFAGTYGSGVWRRPISEMTAVETNKDNSPTEFALEQNFPNPFNPGTTFRYLIPIQSKVVIKVYDILGNEVATLLDEEKSVGTYELTWNAEQLPSGVYFYQLRAGDFTQTKKMILLR